MITMQNKGLLDVDLLKLMGASVKETDNPIGFFGTGLKYAIAILLREEINFSLFVGTNEYKFFYETKTIRDRQFDICMMQGPCDSIELPFTLDYGKNWLSWQAFRELYSNCLDENGVISYSDDLHPKDNYTTICIYDAIDTEGVFLKELDKTCLYKDNRVEIYAGESRNLYYRGIKAKELSKPCQYTYNLLNHIDLTEDRLIAHEYQVDRELSTCIAKCDNEYLVRSILNAKDQYFESNIDFYWSDSAPAETFKAVVAPNTVSNKSAEAFFTKHEPKVLTREERLANFMSELKDLCDEYDVNIEEPYFNPLLELSGGILEDNHE